MKKQGKNSSGSAPSFSLSRLMLQMSCLQKAIRRGHEEEAYYWACQLMQNGRGGETAMWNRLRVIASEDIGLVGNAVAVVNSLGRSFDEIKREPGVIGQELENKDPDLFTSAEVIDNLAELYRQVNNQGKMLFISHAILYLCRSAKNREVDHFIQHMNGRVREGWKPEVPDYAQDRHTAEGRRMKRGMKHFYDEGPAGLENRKGGSKYLESARKFDLAIDEEQPKAYIRRRVDAGKEETNSNEQKTTEKVS